MAKKIAEGVALGMSYEVFDRTGVVSHSETRSETEVEGSVSGGGGYSYGGTGFTSPVYGRINSKTTRFQNIFLTDDNDVEHSIELQNFLIPCKPDHKLTLMLLTSGGRDTGSYFSAYNHNTRTTHDYPKAVRSEMFPLKIFKMALAAIYLMTFLLRFGESDTTFLGSLFFAALITGIIAIPLYGIGLVVGWYRSLLVQRNLAVKNYIPGLAAT